MSKLEITIYYRREEETYYVCTQQHTEIIDLIPNIVKEKFFCWIFVSLEILDSPKAGNELRPFC
jgi:hypothetical protein